MYWGRNHGAVVTGNPALAGRMVCNNNKAIECSSVQLSAQAAATDTASQPASPHLRMSLYVSCSMSGGVLRHTKLVLVHAGAKMSSHTVSRPAARAYKHTHTHLLCGQTHHTISTPQILAPLIISSGLRALYVIHARKERPTASKCSPAPQFSCGGAVVHQMLTHQDFIPFPGVDPHNCELQLTQLCSKAPSAHRLGVLVAHVNLVRNKPRVALLLLTWLCCRLSHQPVGEELVRQGQHLHAQVGGA